MNRPTPVDAALRPHPDDHVRGKLGAAVVLIEYGDFQCPTCRQAAPAVELLLEQYGDQIQFVFRHYPLESLHPDALAAAEAAECAAAQSKFWPMHRLLFDNQQHLKPADLKRYAGELQLDVDRFATELGGHAYLPNVRRDIQLGELARVRATPGFFINSQAQDVSFGMRSLHDAVERALNPSGS